MGEDKYKTYEYSTRDPVSDERCTVYELDKALRAIKVRNMNDIDRIRRLENENKKLKAERYKDEELSVMKTQLEEMKKAYYRGFPVSEEEQKQIVEWMNKHNKEVHNCCTLEDKVRRGGCIGETYTYEFTPTSIGTIGTVKCSCGAEFVFQDI